MSTQEVVQGYLAAAAAGDQQKQRSYMADSGFSFHGPLEVLDNADDLLASLQKLAQIVKNVEKRAMLVDGDNACVIYNLVTNTPAGTSRVAEWYRVENDKIVAVEVFFDARPFASMFEK